MSSSEMRSRVELQSSNPAVQFRLIDHHQQVVAHGEGRLEQDVAPGIYRLEIDSGPVVTKELIALDPGREFVKREIAPEIPTAAPIQGTSTFVQEHGDAAARLSLHPTHQIGSGGRLVLFVRSVADDGSEGVVDVEGFSVGLPGEDVFVAEGERDDSWGAVSIDLDPGGYRLLKRVGGQTVAQPAWVSEGWTTYCFVAQPVPDRRERDYFAAHMGWMDDGYEWGVYDEGQGRLSAEIVLSGLRRGETLLPDDLLQAMLHDKFVNPFLGILGAHALLQRAAPKWGTFDTVIRNLNRLVPGHPDVVALFAMGKSMRDNEASTRAGPIDWPPMLYAGYQGLIDRDLIEEDLIRPGSQAERAASRLIPEGPWTTWRTGEDVDERSERLTRLVEQQSSQMSDEEMDRLASLVTEATRWVEADEELSGLADPATVEQVAQYVSGVAISHEEYFDPSQIAAQVRLPQQAVKKAIRALDDTPFGSRFHS